MKNCYFVIPGVFLIILLFPADLNADEPEYRFDEIPKSLLKDAKAVVRKNEVELKVTDVGKAVQRVTYALTILNDNGIENSLFVQFYDKFSSVRKIKIDLFDQAGEKIKNGLNVDIEDYSAISGYSVYEDNRVKFIDPKYRTTPFTVEVTYEIDFDGILDYPDWYIYPDYNISVESSGLTVILPPSFNLRYRQQFLADSCKVIISPDKKEYRWNVINLPALRKETYSLSFQEITPVVFIAPEKFKIGGTEGDCTSWANFGKWIYGLNEGKNILPAETQNLVKSLTSGLKNDYDKLRVLYDYMQRKVRYVSIQIGLGGWQTLDAETVDRLGYGDCKALSNYMKSLLDVAGIKSLYTLVRAGKDAAGLKEGFPSNQFNHAILCVPMNNDTIWLECTSQNIPFGFLGTFTDDRKALVITENGGKVVQTRKYGLNDNLQIRNANIDIGKDGNFKIDVQTTYKGALYDDIYPVLMMDEADRKKFIFKLIALPSYNLMSFVYNEVKDLVPSINEVLSLSVFRLLYNSR